MSGKYLLDTNIVIALFNVDGAVIDRLQSEENVLIPSIVLGELYYGAQNSARVTENTARVDELRDECVILGCDEDTARYYARVKISLKRKGRPIPENDIWIAAIAQQNSLTVVSRDDHFLEVDLLEFERW